MCRERGAEEENSGGRGIPLGVKKAVTERFLRSGQAERVFIFLYTLLLVCYDSCCYLYRRIVFHFAVFLWLAERRLLVVEIPLGFSEIWPRGLPHANDQGAHNTQGTSGYLHENNTAIF